MLRNKSVLLGVLIAIIIFVGLWNTCIRTNSDPERIPYSSDETFRRDASGSVTTVDIQGKDVAFTSVGEFTDTIVQLGGPWTVGQAPDAYNDLCAWASASQPTGANSRGADLSIAYIRPSLPIAGRYDIYVWWCELKVGNLDRNLEIHVHAKAGEVFQWAYVDLRETSGEWQELGTFYMESDGEVTVSNWNGAIALDAIRFVYRDDLRELATPPIPMPPPPFPSPTPTSEE